jgi:LemA protein
MRANHRKITLKLVSSVNSNQERYRTMTALFVIIAVVLVIGLLTWLIFNGLIRKRTRTEEAWSEIDVELKRRHDLVPNLISTVEGYAAHEQGTFDKVTRARSDAIAAGETGDPDRIAPAEDVLSGALRSLFAVAENYPQLRAVESFLQLQDTLTSTEDKIEYARRYYNTSVRDYNIALRTFPRNAIAGIFRFAPRAFFSSPEDDRAVPTATFGGSEAERTTPAA